MISALTRTLSPRKGRGGEEQNRGVLGHAAWGGGARYRGARGAVGMRAPCGGRVHESKVETPSASRGSRAWRSTSRAGVFTVTTSLGGDSLNPVNTTTR